MNSKRVALRVNRASIYSAVGRPGRVPGHCQILKRFGERGSLRQPAAAALPGSAATLSGPVVSHV